MTAPTEYHDDLCERCRKGRVSPVVIDAMYSYEGEAVSFKDEFLRCEHCGREFYTTEQSMARSRAITAALRRTRGFMTGDEIRNTRLSYDLKLPDFERALGVGKNTIGRWERGTVPPTGAANFGLWVAANAPEVFEKWARLQGVEVKRRSYQTGKLSTSTSQAPSKPILTVVSGGAKPQTVSTTQLRAGSPKTVRDAFAMDALEEQA